LNSSPIRIAEHEEEEEERQRRMLPLLVTLVCVLFGSLVLFLVKKYDPDLTDAKSLGCSVVSGPVPFVRAGLRFVRRPKSWLEEMRKEHGDNFVVSMFGFKMFFTFSPNGLRDLYRAAEQEASFQEVRETDSNTLRMSMNTLHQRGGVLLRGF